ncbi:hypothetical protein [Leptospira sp. P2653]|uniref:hypothetical protein n=1 Tax=Leptospira sp. P2653 TaxID=1218600 RepID=UPI0002BD8592|nr:hypothetical protein LEP1GSC051_0624 [Leptospira sp. P2653]
MNMETYQRPTQGKYRPGPIDILKMARSKKDLLSKIAELDINGRSQYGGCITKNKKLGMYVDLAETTVSKYIREFRKEKLVHQTSFHGSYRTLRISDELYFAIIEERTRNIELAKSRKEAYKNPSLDQKPSADGHLTQRQRYGADPYNNLPSSRTSVPTSVPTYVPAIFDETGIEWGKFLNYADEVLSKSSRGVLHKLKVKSDGKTLNLLDEVSDSLLLVISKYFQEQLKLPLIVQIQKIKFKEEKSENSSSETNQTNVELVCEQTQLEGEIVKNTVGTKPKFNPEIQYEYFRNIRFRDESIRGFLDYSSLKLNRPDLEILRNVRIHYDFEKITFFDPIPEKLKNHIREYFYHKTKSVIAPVFMENRIHFHSAA